MLFVGWNGWMLSRYAPTLPICMMMVNLVLVSQCQGGNNPNAHKGYNFQKEHDGSILGHENGFQQMTMSGKILRVLLHHMSIHGIRNTTKDFNYVVM